MTKEITKTRVYRLVKHMKQLVLIHGDAHEGSTLIDMFEMHALAQEFQTEEYYKKYLGVGKEENAKGKHFDFSENEIFVEEGVAFIISNPDKTVN